MKKKSLLLILSPLVGLSVVIYASTSIFKQEELISPEPTKSIRTIESVAALGQLTTYGEVRKLAAPLSSLGGKPRISRLLVEEGDLVLKNDIIAIFDSRPRIIADLEGVASKIKTLDIKIKMKEREIFHYDQAAAQGAAAMVVLDNKKDELVKLQGQRDESRAEMKGLKVDLLYSQLLAPFDGIVLRVHARGGERPGAEGVVELGANHHMQAIIEVYESDINRIQLGQEVSMISENGGFEGSLLGTVKRISPQVRQRNVLSTDPTGDSDARVVEVLVGLKDSSSSLVTTLTGMKVIARFKPI